MQGLQNNKTRKQRMINTSSANAQNTRSRKMRNLGPNGAQRLPPPMWVAQDIDAVPRPSTFRQPRKQQQQQQQKKKKDDDWWSLGKDLLFHVGTKALMHGISLLTGFGDYNVTTNSLLANATEGANGNVVPILKNGKDHNRISHREYLGDIESSVDFAVNRFVVNPGLLQTFPWMGVIAQQYSKYVMRGAVFEFVSLTSPIGTTQPYLGYIAMGSQYNAVDPPFFDKKSMENSEYASSSKPSENLVHPIECARSSLGTDMLYVRTGAAQEGDPRLYDLCNFTIATGGQEVAGRKMGELWITYDLELYFPKYSTSRTIFTSYYEAELAGFSNPYPLAVLNPIYAQRNTLNVIPYGTGTGLAFTREAVGQKLFVELFWLSPTLNVACSPYVLAETGLVAEEIQFSPSTGSASFNATMSFAILIVAEDSHFTLSGGTIPAYNGVMGKIRISQIPNDS